MKKELITLFKNKKPLGTITWKWSDKKFLLLESYTLTMDPNEEVLHDALKAALDRNALGVDVPRGAITYEPWRWYEGLVKVLEKMPDRHKSFSFTAPDMKKEMAAMYKELFQTHGIP